MAWQWDTFPNYNLKRETLEEFLTEKFGQWDFGIEVNWTRVKSIAEFSDDMLECGEQ
jgi:hypothetical protein